MVAKRSLKQIGLMRFLCTIIYKDLPAFEFFL